jgi:membrane fusion protein (multidrug efflux system)
MTTGRRGRPRKLWIVLAGAAAAAFGGGGYWLHLRGLERTDDAQVEGTVVPVHARVQGFARRVLVRDDQAVSRGDTLYQIDPTEYVLRLRQAEAELWAARANSRQGVAGASAHVASAQKQVAASNLEAARANLDKAQRELARSRVLREKELVSQSALDAAEAAERTARANLQAAQDQAQASDFGEVGAAAQVRLADARIAAAEAALEVARTQLSWTVGIAATSGHVAKRSVEPGQYLTPGQPLMSIVSDSAAWVVANLKETQVERVKPGQPVDIEIDAFPGRTFGGRIRTLQWATGARFSLLPPDNASGNFTKVVQRIPVRIDFADSSARQILRPGMSANVSIRVGG